MNLWIGQELATDGTVSACTLLQTRAVGFQPTLADRHVSAKGRDRDNVAGLWTTGDPHELPTDQFGACLLSQAMSRGCSALSEISTYPPLSSRDVQGIEAAGI